MLKTRLLNTAIPYAKKGEDRCGDAIIHTHNLGVRCVVDESTSTVSIYLHDKKFPKDWIELVGMAIPQICRLCLIPPQWVAVKGKMVDPDHLTESFNRHLKTLENRNLTVRLEEHPEGADSLVYAVWPESTVNLDVLPLLRIAEVHTNPHVSGWTIHLHNHSIRMFGVLKGPTQSGYLPGVFLSTSNDGSSGIRCGLGYGSNKGFCLVGKVYSFKRTESQKGDLQNRYIKCLSHLISQRRSVLNECRRNQAYLRDLKIGKNTGALLEISRKSLTYPKTCDTLLVGFGQDVERSGMGLWRMLVLTADHQAERGDFHTAYLLNRAAGTFLENRDLARAIVEASRT